MKNSYGKLSTLPLGKECSLSFRMPEVPLTKSCPDECLHYSDATNLQSTDAALCAMNEQREAVKGLSLWYTDHLTTMYAIQKFKNYRKAKAKTPEHNYEIPFEYFINDAFKSKRLDSNRDITLENYLSSFKSRQKERRHFGERSKNWERYFAKSIPGWNELKKTRKDDLSSVKRSSIQKLSTLQNSYFSLQTLPNRKASSSLYTCSSELSYKRQTRTNSQGIFHCKQNSAERFSKVTNSRECLGAPAISAKVARDYYLNSAVVKNEQMGNINNEILFNQVYGKYLSKDAQDEIDKEKRQRIKLKKSIRSDIAYLKHLKAKHQTKPEHNEDDLAYLKHIDSLLIVKEKQLSKLQFSDDSESEKEIELEKRNPKRKHFNVKFNFDNIQDPSLELQKQLEIPAFAEYLKNETFETFPKQSTPKKLPKSQPKMSSGPRRKRKLSRLSNISNFKAMFMGRKDNSRGGFVFHRSNLNEVQKPMKNAPILTQPRNKSEFRNQLIETINSVWSSNKNLGGRKPLLTSSVTLTKPA